MSNLLDVHTCFSLCYWDRVGSRAWVHEIHAGEKSEVRSCAIHRALDMMNHSTLSAMNRAATT
jgi:hypothetical protein